MTWGQVHGSQLGEGGASEGVSRVGILNFHLVGAGRGARTSVSGQRRCSDPSQTWLVPSLGCTAETPVLVKHISSHTPSGPVPCGGVLLPHHGKLWAQAPWGPQTCLPGTLSGWAMLWQAGGRVEEVGRSLFCNSPPLKQCSPQGGGPAKPWGGGGGVETCGRRRLCPHKAPSLGHTGVKRGGGSRPRDGRPGAQGCGGCFRNEDGVGAPAELAAGSPGWARNPP